jgi:alkylation response protein AidB-like acyl-CoA dehydrogenase
MLEVTPDAAAAWRDRLARLAVSVHGLKLVSERTLERTLTGQPPGAESSYAKLLWSEAYQRIYEYGLELLGDRARLGPDGDLGRPETDWTRQYLWTRCATIAAGTSEVHRNIIAERTLGMPR